MILGCEIFIGFQFSLNYQNHIFTFEWRLPIGKKMLFQIIVKMVQPI